MRSLKRAASAAPPKLAALVIACLGLVASAYLAVWIHALTCLRATSLAAWLPARTEAALSTAGSMSWPADWPRYESACDVSSAPLWLAFGGGLVVTGGLSAACWFTLRANRRADRLVQEISDSILRKRSRTRAMADTAADAIVVIDEQRHIRWVNQHAAEIFGHATEALHGLAVPQILPAFMGQRIATWLSRHGDGRRAANVETLGLNADGTAFPVTVSVSAFDASGELLYTCIVRATENARSAARELLLRERAIASSTNGITIADMTREGAPFIYVNPAFEDITGYSAHEAIGRNGSTLQRGDTDQPAIASLRQAIAENRSCHVVLRNYRKDGSMFWNDLSISPVQQADGQVTHYVGIQVDITRRKQAEAALQLRTERLNAVFELSPDGFVALDAEGIVTIVNPAFERMTGLEGADLIGSTIDRFEQKLRLLSTGVEVPYEGPKRFVETQPPDVDRVGEALPDQSLEQVLLHLQAPNERTLLRRTRRARDHGKETVMYFRDITRELEVDRMKSEFLSTAAHELRTPMASIFGFAELLLQRTYDPSDQREMLSTIHRQAKVLVNLINELLDLARIEARRGKDFRFALAALQPVVENMLAGLLVHDEDRKVVARLPAEPILLNMDAEKLSLLLTNVLSNAHKYSPGGGDILLDIVWRRQAQGTQVGISVQDHGIGMTEHELQQMFERFYRADASGRIAGTGLGMSIVKEIAELHGGSVSAVSEPNRGTTVTTWLPCPSLQ